MSFDNATKAGEGSTAKEDDRWSACGEILWEQGYQGTPTTTIQLPLTNTNLALPPQVAKKQSQHTWDKTNEGES